MNIGDTVKLKIMLCKEKEGKHTYDKKGIIEKVNKNLITIRYFNSMGELSYSESFNTNDIITGKVKIETKEEELTLEVFKDLAKRNRPKENKIDCLLGA